MCVQRDCHSDSNFCKITPLAIQSKDLIANGSVNTDVYTYKSADTKQRERFSFRFVSNFFKIDKKKRHMLANDHL